MPNLPPTNLQRAYLKTVVDYIAYLAVRTVICAVQALPLETCQAGAKLLAWAMWNVLRLRRSVVEQNLRIAFPDASDPRCRAIALQMWEHLFLMIAEIAHARRKVHRTNWRDHSSILGMVEIIRRLLDRRPLVIISGHLGNFEMGGYLLGLHGFPTHTIARPLDNRFLDRWVTEFRGATGQFMLPKTGSTPAIAALLDRGGTLVLLGDQYAGDGACWVDFFGKPASTHKAMAVFTLSAKAPTATCGIVRADRPLKFEMHVADMIDPSAPQFDLGTIPLVTQWYTAELESLVRAHPGQYWWVHRRWKGSPTDCRGKRRRRRQAAA